ncbi:MAG TPA: hypothetical protein VF540_07660 [Segetibacter sp.]|jgi:hypothetical protein
MIQAKDLRIGNLITWNPALLNPDSTLPPLQVEVFSILQDKIRYVFPNIENRVEPFEDDIAQMGERYKSLNELEPIILTIDILLNDGFTEKGGLVNTKYYEKGELRLKHSDGYFKMLSVTALHMAEFSFPVKYFHQLQNLYFALCGEELETKLHGQQS